MNAAAQSLLSRQDGTAEIQALTPLELTRGFLAHDEQLSRLAQQTSVVFKLPAAAPLAAKLLEEAAQWRSEHVRGRPHPRGSLHTSIAYRLFMELQDSKVPPYVSKPSWNSFAEVLAKLVKNPPPSPLLDREIIQCTARLTAKKTHLLVDLQPQLMGVLPSHMPVYMSLMQTYEGELLGRRPQGGLSRKARGLPYTSLTTDQ